jgi:thioredoxin 1
MQKTMLIQIMAGLLIGGACGALLGYFGKCTSGACPLTSNPWRGGFLGAVIGAMLVFSTTGSRASDEGSKAGHSAVSIASEADFERLVLHAQQPVLVDFYSNGCPPCRMLAPTVEQLAEDYEGRAVVYKVNVDTLPSLAEKHGVQAIPTVVFLHNGREIERLIGLHARAAYAQVLDRLAGAAPAVQ